MHLIPKILAQPPVKLGSTLTCVVSGAIMELTPLSHVLLRLYDVVLFLWLWWVVLGHPTLALSFV